MKFSTPDGKTFGRVLAIGGGLLLGVAGGRAGFAVIHDGEATGTADELKKLKMMGYAKRAVIGAIGLGGAASVQTDDNLSLMLKVAGVSLAGIQVIDGVADAAAESTKLAALTTGTKMQKVAAKTLGLKCPCEHSMTTTVIPLERPRHRGKLRGPGNNIETLEEAIFQKDAWTL